VCNDEITTQQNTTQEVESFMAKDARFDDKKEQKISTIQPTDERLTGRAGLALFEAYVGSIQIFR